MIWILSDLHAKVNILQTHYICQSDEKVYGEKILKRRQSKTDQFSSSCLFLSGKIKGKRRKRKGWRSRETGEEIWYELIGFLFLLGFSNVPKFEGSGGGGVVRTFKEQRPHYYWPRTDEIQKGRVQNRGRTLALYKHACLHVLTLTPNSFFLPSFYFFLSPSVATISLICMCSQVCMCVHLESERIWQCQL